MLRPVVVLLVLVGVVGCGPSQREIALLNASSREVEPARAAPIRANTSSAYPGPRIGPRLPVGTRIVTVLDRSITATSNRVGATVASSVAFDVKDSAGQVVIPGGSRVDLVIVRLEPGPDPGRSRVDLTVAAVTIQGKRYGLGARIVSQARALRSEAEVAAASAGGRNTLLPGGTMIVLELTRALAPPVD